MSALRRFARSLAPHWPPWGFVVVAVVFFCIPLFIGLGRWDLRNDESIYSYAVDRILETGDWLTPKSIPGDDPFLEKPPLKMWLVAGAMWLGLTPHNELGMRIFDAAFGAVAFLYVLAFAGRLAGLWAGLVALLVLFTLEPLLLEHGLRSNNMEAALVLAYAGGLYHFARWADTGDRHRRRLHALAFAGYLALGFLTKFVAVVFLPAVAVTAFAWRAGAWSRARTAWSDWILPAAMFVLLASPWFVYQTYQHGRVFWDGIFGWHVYLRFTSALDPSHIQPWHFYVTQTWTHLFYAGSHWVGLAGVAALGWYAIKRGVWLARLALVWLVLPVAGMSFSTSKLMHYAYPFLPPIAIGAGLLVVQAIRTLDRYVAFGDVLAQWRAYLASRAPVLRGLVAIVGLALVAIGLLTAWADHSIALTVGNVRLFRNTSTIRPLLIAIPFLALAVMPGPLHRWVSIPVLALLLPLHTYPPVVRKLVSLDSPLRAIRDCALNQIANGVAPPSGLFVSAIDFVAHPYQYYFRKLGPWASDPHRTILEARVRLFRPGRESLMVVSVEDLAVMQERWPLLAVEHPTRTREVYAGTDLLIVGAIQTEPRVLVLLPGPFRRCAAPALAAGGHPSGQFSASITP